MGPLRLRRRLATPRNRFRLRRVVRLSINDEVAMKGVLLWLIGIPIPVIIILYLLHVL